MNWINKLYHKFRTLILYGIIGCCSSGLDFIIFTFLVSFLGWNYIFANCCSVLAGIITSFTLNRNFNFRVKDKSKQRFGIFLFVGLSGMLLSNVILGVCISMFNLNDMLAKLLSIVLVVVFQFILNKNITFRQTLPTN